MRFANSFWIIVLRNCRKLSAQSSYRFCWLFHKKIYLTKFLHYEVFKVQCGFKAAVPLISGTFNILAHALLSVKHFFNFFSKFFSARGLVYAQCFAAGYFRQLDYITTLYSPCQAPFSTFFDKNFECGKSNEISSFTEGITMAQAANNIKY